MALRACRFAYSSNNGKEGACVDLHFTTGGDDPLQEERRPADGIANCEEERGEAPVAG